MALMVVHSGTGVMESISDVPCYLVLNYLTWYITVRQKFKGRGGGGGGRLAPCLG